ncbi:hypothetical protein NK6_5293 [Bradyrhizobium diazoefficiens]|uniref:Uncharacterized protein n=1 Tax=Bradyrhizobium diazoefficiens TaxID=1355477 RepID=A0A0E4BQV7_9BRAD|nr:hypothetical protein NK6_1856 [Bradyrhizobium diazoefficiens]BAR58452.1 hypothetical protein NK6_5293 [Bradyrhizobium diazoefficiens]
MSFICGLDVPVREHYKYLFRVTSEQSDIADWD